MELGENDFEIKLIEAGLHKGFFAGNKRQYDFSSLKMKGNYIEIEKKKRWVIRRSIIQWMGENTTQMPFKIELRYKDGKCYLVRMS